MELVQTKVKAEFGNEVFTMLDALSECMEKISKDCWLPHWLPLFDFFFLCLDVLTASGVEVERSQIWFDHGTSTGRSKMKKNHEKSGGKNVGQFSGLQHHLFL